MADSKNKNIETKVTKSSSTSWIGTVRVNGSTKNVKVGSISALIKKYK